MAEQVGEIFLIVSEMFCYITHFQIFCAVKTDVFNDVKINLFGRCRLSSKTATCAILSGQRESYYPAGH